MTKALVVSEGITYRSLRGKLEEKIDLNRKRYEMELRYLTPGRPNLPPLVVNDDDDLEAFMFLNCQANDAIWAIELYANLKEKGDQEFTKAEYGKQQISEAEIAVFPSPPPVTQSQEAQAMMRDQPYGDCNISVTNNTSAHLDRNLIDCDLFETKPLNVEVPDAVMNITCLPPVVKRRIGRPRKNRIPSRGEYKGRRRRCGSCNTLGHNKRNCPNPSTSAAAP